MTADTSATAPPNTRQDARERVDLLYENLTDSFADFQQNLSITPPSIQADMHLYLCIRMAGFLEQLVFLTISGYMRELLGGHARNFYGSWFWKAPNLTPEQFKGLIKRFDDPWKTEFQNFLSDGLRTSTLKNLLEIRNKVAHGQSYTGGRGQLTSYMELVSDIKDWMYARFVD
ncbi:hypothetical protein GCM10022223_46770 [Kineosporia mesophila]|uniref:RiboL-PSP-HEPN domain-containing protein n=1 Tax=Kineosporia mesophila TaxID=566012 RepID=A0ABP7A3T7_9ACTN|nr:HEPN domain-containing protein [Kineosporia mesophila]MCD5353788.1 hypothetical protein [Kineosporia mesophila]